MFVTNSPEYPLAPSSPKVDTRNTYLWQTMKSESILSWLFLGGLVWLAPTGVRAETKASAGIDFARQIRPILSDNCFNCHGPDDKARKGGLRLDLHEDALKAGKSGKHAIIPGNVAESELLKRINTPDPDDVMPPPKFGKTLTPAQKELLQRWVKEGAPWMTHWAYEPAKRPELPKVQAASWGRNEIDRFILARLEKEGLKPSAPADKATLIRRVTLDLTGLPPTPAEVDAFLADTSAQAYEKLVDRLLQSPHYGEHMAKYWLDAARYADSHGYHIDAERSLWKYRDWVVSAFNQNLPFDQFTIEQLAGDLLPSPTLDQKVASGYVRCNMSTGEGGAIIEEYQAKYSFDRTETMGTTWLGLTLVCSRCHSHKYDPISQKEYYGLYSFFNNLRESVMDGNAPNPDPSIQVPTKDQTSRLEELKKLIADGDQKLNAAMPDLDREQEKWEKEWRERLGKYWTVAEPARFLSTSNAQFKTLPDQSLLVSGPNPPKDVYQLEFPLSSGTFAGLKLETLPDDSLPQKGSSRADDGKFRLSELEAEWVTPSGEGKEPSVKSIKFARALADASIKDREIEKAIDGKADTGWQPTDQPTVERHTALFILGEPLTVSTAGTLRLKLKSEASVNRRAIGRFRLSLARSEELVSALAPPKPPPWHVLGALKAGEVAETLVKPLEPESGDGPDLQKTYPGAREDVKWSARNDLEDGKSHVLVSSLHGVHGVYYLSRKIVVPADQQVELAVRADDVFRLWLNRELIGERRAKEAPGDGPLRVVVRLRKGENHLLVKMVNVQGDSRFSYQQTPLDRSVLPADVAVLFAGLDQFTPEQKTKLQRYFRRVSSDSWRQSEVRLALWREEETGLNRVIPTTMVAREEMEKPRDTFMLIRGEYDKVGEKAARGVPSIFPPFPKDTATNRLGLAKWLLLPSHPLTSRVTVNRFWQQYFGVGIVKTSDDFGVQGEPPSHPELLDWLATEFIESGWDMKHLQKLIVTSAAYRQTSKQSPELRARDPENRLVSRGPRFRVDGEVLRDSALFIGGLLRNDIGGRSVKPYEPPGLWEAVSFNNSQKYIQDGGEAQYRRSVYTHWKRQSPPPNMLLFDAPTREYCVVRRPRTNTPLQALALLNDPQFVEASRAFADRVLREGGTSDEARLRYAFRLATARPPTAAELKVLAQVLGEQRAEFQKDQEGAKKLLGVGEYRASSTAAPADLAAWATVASMILNLDETVTKI